MVFSLLHLPPLIPRSSRSRHRPALYEPTMSEAHLRNQEKTKMKLRRKNHLPPSRHSLPRPPPPFFFPSLTVMIPNTLNSITFCTSIDAALPPTRRRPPTHSPSPPATPHFRAPPTLFTPYYSSSSSSSLLSPQIKSWASALSVIFIFCCLFIMK